MPPEQEPEGPPQPYIPPEVVVYRPQGADVIKPGDGTVSFEFLVSPLKVISIQIPEDAARELASRITSGIVVPAGMPRMDVPKGRRPQ